MAPRAIVHRLLLRPHDLSTRVALELLAHLRVVRGRGPLGIARGVVRGCEGGGSARAARAAHLLVREGAELLNTDDGDVVRAPDLPGEG